MPDLEAALREMPYLCNVWVSSFSRLRVTDPLAFAKVRQLKLGATPLEDETLGQLQSLPSLMYLEISGYNNHGFSDAGLASIGKYAALETLVIDDTNITDAGVAQLVGLKRLRQLDLSATAITDDVMDSLVQMKSLENLSIRDTRVSQPAMRRLLELPNLKQVEISTGASRGRSSEIHDLLQKHIKNVDDF